MNRKIDSEISCAVMITSHNRLLDLQKTCANLRKLCPQPDEWLFTADGCHDDTDEWLRGKFPNAKIFVNDPGLGSVASRDRMMREADSDLVLALDDDSYPCEGDAVRRIKEFHVSRPEVAVSTFPQRTEEYPESLERKEFSEHGPVNSYPNSGACYVTDVYRKLPGFPVFFFHAYEEPDYSLQCMANGYQVYHTPIITIRHHFTSAGRDECRTHQQHARNEFWSVLMRCPLPFLPFVLVGKIFSQFLYAWKRGGAWVRREPNWWYRALKGVPRAWRNRGPVSWSNYRQWLFLSRPRKTGTD